jgi:MoaA/NifB/PqqE/SkfB family radical SAM enzyme/SAM-dependent methyltransferase
MNRVISHPLFAAAKTAFESKDYFSAEEKCAELLDRKEVPHMAYMLLGKVYLKLNKTIEALVFLEKAFNLDACNIEIAYELAQLYYDLGYYKQSAQIITNLDIQDPSQDIMNPLKLKLKTKGNKESTDLLLKLEEFNKSFPTIFTFETVLSCNLKCPECAIGHGLINRKREKITFEKFKIIADKVKPFVKYFYLHLWGEPMLNKDIFKIIQYASNFSKTNISTNALLIDKEKAELLIKSGVSDLIVSIDGYTQETYEKYRVGGDINKVFDALNYLVTFNKIYGNKVIIMPQFIVFKHNQHELVAFRAFCQSLGLIPSFKSPYIRQNDSVIEPSDIKEYRREEYNNVELLQQAMSNCDNPKEVLTVNIDGSVVICCHDYNRQTNFGNLFEQDVLEIWNNPDYRKFRWNILRGNAPTFCIENCMSYKLKQVDQNKNNIGGLKQKSTMKVMSENYRRVKKHIKIINIEKAIDLARRKFEEGMYNDSFDIYEQLTEIFPHESVEILAEVYDKYEILPRKSRWDLYQSRLFDFGIRQGEKVLDIGSGHNPFPLATHLSDITLNDNNYGRAGVPFKYVDKKPVYEFSVENIPFSDKEFDFVYCSHVLEHAVDPQRACEELMRIAKRGYIETPSRAKDLWLNSALVSNHRWSLCIENDTLVFEKYDEKEIKGIQNDILMSMHVAPQTKREKAFSALIYLKADFMNTMMIWENDFLYKIKYPKKVFDSNILRDVSDFLPK